MKPTPADFVRFVEARQWVYVNRAKGKPKPWTDDPILQSYRFCNVYREHDTVTVWLRQNWSKRWAEHPDLWFAMVIGRLINWPATMEVMGKPLPFNPVMFVNDLEHLQARGPKPVFGPAYIVSTNGHSMPKAQYLSEYVLAPLWLHRKDYRPRPADTLASFHNRLTQANGLGSFMAAQVVADVKNTVGQALVNADDWWTWASPGPGSLRGLNRLAGNGPVKTGINQIKFTAGVDLLQHEVNIRFKELGWRALCAQDVQNCLCEFDKYQRVLLGEGRPKQLYPGVA